MPLLVQIAILLVAVAIALPVLVGVVAFVLAAVIMVANAWLDAHDEVKRGK